MSPERARAKRHSTGSLTNVALRAVDLTGRERHLRSAMHAMSRIATRFARSARRTLPFLVRQRSRLVPQPVAILDVPANDADLNSGPSFEARLEAEDGPTWGSVTLNAQALGLILEGALGGGAGASSELGAELTLAQRALVTRIVRSLADDFARALQNEVELGLSVVSMHSLSVDDLREAPDDGLRVDCLIEGAPAAAITLAIGAEALQAATREQEQEPPQAGDPRMVDALRDVPVEIVAELGRTTLGLQAVLDLKIGQVLRLPTAVDDLIRVRVEGIQKFVGRPATSRGQIAVEVRGWHED